LLREATLDSIAALGCATSERALTARTVLRTARPPD
jgi:hypothetical protein